MLIEYIPLQQGLRPREDYASFLLSKLIEYIPLQQGLRLNKFLKPTKELVQLIEYIPLQQGLRQSRCFLNTYI